MSMTTTQYAGHEAVLIEAGPVRLVASTSVGPRILALLTDDGANAFAELPDMTLPCPGSEPIHLRGGHRLWAAPEVPRVTYRPDDDPVRVEPIPAGVRLTTRSDLVAGTSRETSITVTGPGCVRLDYRVTNTADRPQRLAGWAITMMAPLGRTWLPFITGEFDAGGFQAQRNIVLWSYTHTDDPRFILSDAAIELRAALIAERGITDSFKVGTSLRRGWLAHWREGVLFVKRAAHDEAATYADMGASGADSSRIPPSPSWRRWARSPTWRRARPPSTARTGRSTSWVRPRRNVSSPPATWTDRPRWKARPPRRRRPPRAGRSPRVARPPRAALHRPQRRHRHSRQLSI